MPPTNQRHQQIILDSIADGVFTVDRDWSVTSFNRAAERITGIPRREAIGRKCWEVFRASICEGNCALGRTMDSGKPCLEKTIYIVNNEGRRIPVSISTALLKGTGGKVEGGVETFRDLSALEELRKEIRGKGNLGDIITKDHRMFHIFDTLPAVAKSESTVLIQGDSGTGKELLARAIHRESPRCKGPFVSVNCSALPDTLLESELFGYRKGAFTDAKRDKPGRFDLARGGTLFLDEIGDISSALQVKLLRVLQEKMYDPLGAVEPVKADCRIIAATNRNLSARMEEGAFRRDLFYRINVVPISLPPLRERRGDIPLLVEHFIHRYNALYEKSITGVADAAMGVLMAHSFPGNVRELENIMEHAFVMCSGRRIEKRHLPENLRGHPGGPTAAQAQNIEEFEAARINAALRRNRFNRLRTAAELGMHKTTLWRKMKKLGLE